MRKIYTLIFFYTLEPVVIIPRLFYPQTQLNQLMLNIELNGFLHMHDFMMK